MRWDKLKLGEVCVLNYGKNLPAAKRKKGNVPVYSSAGKIDFHSLPHVDSEGIIIGRKGSVGKIYFSDGPFFPIDTSYYILPDEKYNLKFLYYNIQILGLEDLNSDAAVPGLNRNNAYAQLINIPPIPTQKRIADILSAYDDLIENNLKRIKLLEQAAQNIYKEWFVHMRFPGHEDAVMDEETGLPEGWEELEIGSFAYINGSSIKKGKSPAVINYVDISSVGTGFYSKPVEIDFESAPSRARRILKHGDSIFSTVRPNRKIYAHISRPEKNLIASTGFAIISPKIDLDSSFIYFTVSNDSFISETVALATGSAYPAINQKNFESITITVPSENLRIRFDSIVGDILNAKGTLFKQNQKLKSARDILLPRLMNRTIEV